MKEAENRAQQKKNSVKTTAVRVATVLGCAAMCIAQTGFCNSETDAIVNSLIDQICSMLRYVGLVVIVIGVGKFALAMKDENPDGQTRAVYYAVAGAVLVSLRTIVGTIVPGIN